MRAFKIHIVAFLLIISFSGYGQTQVEVITKTVEKRLAYKEGFALDIQGQGANISLLPSATNDIKVTLKFVSKGLTRKVAEQELAYQKYVVDELNKTFVIRNYLLLPSAVDELSTIQETHMQIEIPKGLTMKIINSFGSTTLKGVSGRSTIANEYGDITISDYQGATVITGNYGDLKIQQFKGTIVADVDHIEVLIEKLTGSAKIDAYLGNVTVKNPNQIADIKVIGGKSDITLEAVALDNYYWDIKTKYGSLDAPMEIMQADNDEKEDRVIAGEKTNPQIHLSTDFGDITIRKK